MARGSNYNYTHWEAIIDRLKYTFVRFLPSEVWWRVQRVERVNMRGNKYWHIKLTCKDQTRTEVFTGGVVDKILAASRTGRSTTVYIQQRAVYEVFCPLSVYGVVDKHNKIRGPVV